MKCSTWFSHTGLGYRFILFKAALLSVYCNKMLISITQILCEVENCPFPAHAHTHTGNASIVYDRKRFPIDASVFSSRRRLSGAVYFISYSHCTEAICKELFWCVARGVLGLYFRQSCTTQCRYLVVAWWNPDIFEKVMPRCRCRYTKQKKSGDNDGVSME